MDRSSQCHSVQVGDVAPDFTLETVDGKLRSLSDYRGKKVMLSFHRFASCPFCNLAIDQLMGQYKKLAWAAHLEVLKVFQSPGCNIEKYVLRGKGAASASNYPFILLSDTEQETYNTYNDAHRGVLGAFAESARTTVRIATNRRKMRDAHAQLSKEDWDEMKKQGGNMKLLPADFLIDEDGRIVDCFRAKRIDQHIPLDRVELFLLGKAKSQVECAHSSLEEQTSSDTL